MIDFYSNRDSEKHRAEPDEKIPLGIVFNVSLWSFSDENPPQALTWFVN